MMSDAVKTPNEVASAIKDKKARVAIKTLLRKQSDNVRRFLTIGNNEKYSTGVCS